jgi:hypothetical protein
MSMSMNMSMNVQLEKKEYLLVRSPRAIVESERQLNHFAAVRFATLYQDP